MTGGTTLLGGRVRHDQPAHGHRTGIEPVLLAASVPARPGEAVLEGGSGAGAALLCLAHRVVDLHGIGLERDPALVTLARSNAAANGFALLHFRAADLIGAQIERVDHSMANPPWHSPGGTASPDAGQEMARRAAPGSILAWTRALAAPLRHHGTLTLIVAAAALAEGLASLVAGQCGSPAVMPLWPRTGIPAKLVLLRGIKGGRGPSRLLPGLVLHEADGSYTPQADAILRHGDALGW